MKLCICFGIFLSSKCFHLRLIFSFLKLWADNSSTNQYSYQFVKAGRWHTSCHPISKMHIVGEGPGETPSALKCLSYLINNFLTDIKQLAKTSMGALSIHLLMSMSEGFLVPFYILTKICYTKALEWSSLAPGPKAKSSSSEINNPTPFTVSYQVNQELWLGGLSDCLGE